MPTKRRSAVKKRARPRKLRVVGKKTVRKKREEKAVHAEAANTIKRRAAAWRAAATKKPPAAAAAPDIQVAPAEVPTTAPEVPLTTE
jgi:hypothetical protein